MKLIMMACALGVSIDQRTNQASLFSLLEEMEPATYPAVTPQLQFFAYMERDNSKEKIAHMRLRIALDSEIIADGPFEVEFQGLPKARGIADIGGIPIKHAGTLSFTLHNTTKKLLGTWKILLKPATDMPTIDGNSHSSGTTAKRAKRKTHKQRRKARH